MKERYRIEIYDEDKNNDLTIYSAERVDKTYLTEIVFSNLRQFSGNIRAYVYDTIKKRKTVALYLPNENIKPRIKSKLTKYELGLY